MTENNIDIEFNSNLEEYKKLIEKLYEQTLALKAISEEVDGFEVRFELKEHEQLPEYDQDEAVNFIQEKLGYTTHVGYSNDEIREILNADEDYMHSKGIIED